MKSINKLYVCPCCGFAGLEIPPYEKIGFPPWSNHGVPPYQQKYGEASFDVCSSCGFEFGLDDEPPNLEKTSSFEKHLENWILSGCEWFDETKKPAGWKLEEQLQKAGIQRSQ